jgi:hypothetical protein
MHGVLDAFGDREVSMERSEELARECAQQLRPDDPFALLSHVGAVMRDFVNPVPLYRLADFCRSCGRLDLWRRAVDIAFTLDHETYEQVYHRAMAKGLLGDFSAWTDFEARAFNPEWGCSRAKLNWTHCLWDGEEDVRDKSILIRRQGGFGDEILMFRYVKPLAAKAGRVLLDVKPELVDLATHNFGQIATVVSMQGDRPPEADRFIWAMSLPHIFGELFPLKTLVAPSLVKRAGPMTDLLHVGLCWSCGITARDHAQRSIAFSALAPLLELQGVQWHNLQVGAPAASAVDSALLIPDPPLDTFADTASLIASLDCVISVDTAVFHVSGSLGIPTFLILCFASDWKWGMTDANPWYPSVQVLRQRVPGEWSPVVAALCDRIRGMVISGSRNGSKVNSLSYAT